jgi:hypothetical protein
MSRPVAGTWCDDCRVQGHRCEAVVFVGEQPLCLSCADGDPCSATRVPSWNAVGKVREKVMQAKAMEAQKSRGGWFKRLSPQEQDQFRRDITGNAAAAADKYGVNVATVYNFRKKFGIPSTPREASEKEAIAVRRAVVIEPSAPPAVNVLLSDTPLSKPPGIRLELSPAAAVNIFTLLPPSAQRTALEAALEALTATS